MATDQPAPTTENTELTDSFDGYDIAFAEAVAEIIAIRAYLETDDYETALQAANDAEERLKPTLPNSYLEAPTDNKETQSE